MRWVFLTLAALERTNMTDKQPEALMYADILAHKIPSIQCLEEAAAELRRLHESEREGWRYADELEQDRKRLHEVNAELVEALKYCRQKIAYMTEHGEWYSPGRAIEKADAALRKATGENND